MKIAGTHNYRLLSVFWMIPFILAYPDLAKGQFREKLFTPNLLVEGKLHYGFLYAQHLELEVFNAHFPAFELVLQKQTYGRNKWERDYNYPLVGISFFYSGVGNNPSLGSAYGLMPFINFPLVKNPVVAGGFRVGLGIGYITNPFHRILNYRNLAIGSHLNAAVNLMFELRVRINELFTMTGGIGLQHFSNGSLKLPNYGINLPLINVGLAYRPFRENRSITNRFIAPTEEYSAIVRKYLDIQFGGFIGYKDMSAVYGKKYVVYHFYSNGLARVSAKSMFGIGFDISYDPSHLTTLEMHGTPVQNKLSILRPGINGAYHLTMGQLGIMMNLGCYLGGKEKSNGPLYEKLAVQYNITPELFASVMLKVHWGRADYIGWGLGYKFKVRYGKRTVR